MKKNYFILILLWTVTFGYAQNLITNGDFENFTGNTPDGWTTIDSGITTAEETTIVEEGSKSLKITVNTTDQENTDIRQTINIVAGTTYDIFIHFHHISGDNDAMARLYIGGFGSIYSSPSYVNVWGSIQAGFVATQTQDIEVGLRFYDLSNFDGSSVIYVDSFEISDANLSVEESEIAQLSVFPNPTTNGYVHIIGKTNDVIAVQVFDILGKQVINQTVNNNILNVASLTSGVYILKISQNGNTTTKKLVIK